MLNLRICKYIKNNQYVIINSSNKLFYQCKSFLSITEQEDVLNNQIKFNIMRVVYEESGIKVHKILDRITALKFAKSKGLDLMLVNQKSDPVVCKLINYHEYIKAKNDDDKTLNFKQSNSVGPKPLKEIYLKSCIEPNDFNIKLSKAKSFLMGGHQVKFLITVAPKIKKLRNDTSNVISIDELTLKLLEALEPYASMVQELEAHSINRKDIIVNPKAKSK